MKSFVPKDRGGKPPSVKRAAGVTPSATSMAKSARRHALPTTDPDARLFRKRRQGGQVCHMGHLMTETAMVSGQADGARRFTSSVQFVGLIEKDGTGNLTSA